MFQLISKDQRYTVNYQEDFLVLIGIRELDSLKLIIESDVLINESVIKLNKRFETNFYRKKIVGNVLNIIRILPL